ncbi:Multifunctional cyclase-dehydratase-3-O-methyl transferase TcmN [Aquicella siphonis]|uniref:Multifunctional cyclase-dehydratase-3-O-methyl transferase TcmN n=1 Tax=Aquicella siphonis TaxID=254247 RepID=A0A5E4PGH0_9COXI|nr:methyltransferase [Aquicella siphonis]VVC75572.1 Multifunctional cyclase-dehydratase-3-O-methyl transferase TcmN [Aquicella siphonis]
MLIRDLLFAYYDTQCLYVAACLNIADHLQSGPKSIAELAGLARSNEDKLYRIMRYLSAKGLFDELSGRVFQINPESACLVSSRSGGLKHFIRLHSQYFYPAASELLNSLRSDLSPFELQFGKPSGQYFQDNVEAGEVYHHAMMENSEWFARQAVEAYDFSPYQTLVDIGGGIGTLLAAILLKYKNAKGINFDLPELQEPAERYFKTKGLASRCRFIGGDFLEGIPAGGDLYIMKSVIHGKDDSMALRLLGQFKPFLAPPVKLLVMERVLQGSGAVYLQACLNDINMLNVTRGRVRTYAEYEELFTRSGLTINKLYELQNAFCIMEVQLSR